MLFWWENILMICFIFYLNCLNNKEKLLKFSIYKKYNFLLNLGIWILICLKGNQHSYLEGFKGKIQIPLTSDSLA